MGGLFVNMGLSGCGCVVGMFINTVLLVDILLPCMTVFQCGNISETTRPSFTSLAGKTMLILLLG
jgi:hypothetical protein